MAGEFGRSAGLTGYADLCRALGLDPYRLAAEAGAPAAALSDPDIRIPSVVVGRMLEFAARRAGIDDFGLRLAETRRLSNMGAVALVVKEQPSLRRALEVMAQYQWMQNEALALTLDEAEEVALASFRITAEGGRTVRQAAELSCGALCRNIRAVMGESWRPQAVVFRHGPPASLQVHRRVFGVEPQFGQDHDGLVLRRSDLDTPLSAADPAMAAQAERLLRTLAERRTRSFEERVSELIVLLLPTGACTADRVARHLGCDRRTMHRHLAAEGVNFSGLLETRRRDLVLSLIADAHRSMAAIADLAGFAGPSAFSHWALRKLGAPPSALRRARSASAG